MKPTVKFTPVAGGTAVTAELGDGYAAVTASGGWQNVARPRRTAMTEWVGRDPITMDVPIMLDGGLARTSVEGSVATLYSYMLDLKGTAKEPTAVRVTGVPVPFKEIQWLVSSIQPGDEMRREEDGFRHRAAMTVTLLEYVAGDIIVKTKPQPAKVAAKSTPAAKAAAKTPAAAGAKTYTVKSGDTLWAIAAREYGNGNSWQKIATANSIRDPRALRVGQSLKIPA